MRKVGATAKLLKLRGRTECLGHKKMWYVHIPIKINSKSTVLWIPSYLWKHFGPKGVMTSNSLRSSYWKKVQGRPRVQALALLNSRSITSSVVLEACKHWWSGLGNPGYHRTPIKIIATNHWKWPWGPLSISLDNILKKYTKEMQWLWKHKSEIYPKKQE